MRILMLNHEYPPLGGGAGHATLCLLHEYRGRDDLQIDLVTSSTGGARIEEFASNIRLHFIDVGTGGNRHFQNKRDLLTYYRRARTAVYALMAAHGYHCCHAFFGVPSGYLALHTGLPYIVSLQGSDVPVHSAQAAIMDSLVFRRLSRRVWNRAAAVVANSAGLKSLALRCSPDQEISLIPNGVDIRSFHPAGAPVEGMALLCVARLVPRKGIDDIIHALPLLPEVTLILVGAGPAERDLRALVDRVGVADRVRWLGAVGHAELPAIYRQAAVYVLPSRNEGMSHTALEALASGLPVLLTATGGTDELLHDGGNGFMIRPGDPGDIASKVRLYTESLDMRRRHGRVSRAIAETMTWSTVAEAYLALYRQAAVAAT